MSTSHIHPVLHSIKLWSSPVEKLSCSLSDDACQCHHRGSAHSLDGDYYTQFALGGFGLIISEGTFTDAHDAPGYPGQPGMIDEIQEQAWGEVVSSVHQHGAKMVMQLMHAGALSQVLEATAGPSAIQPLRHRMPEYGGGSGPYLQ